MLILNAAPEGHKSPVRPALYLPDLYELSDTLQKDDTTCLS